MCKSNDLSSSSPPALTIHSSASVQNETKETFSLSDPKLKSSSEALPTVLSAIFTLLSLLQYHSYVLPFMPFCCTQRCFAYSMCRYYILRSRNEKRNKNTMPVLFLKSTMISHWNEKAAGSLIMSSFFLDLYVY